MHVSSRNAYGLGPHDSNGPEKCAYARILHCEAHASLDVDVGIAPAWEWIERALGWHYRRQTAGCTGARFHHPVGCKKKTGV